MFGFQHYIPTRIIFGVGSVEKIGQETKIFGNKALIVTGQKSAETTGLLGKCKSLLKREGIKIKIYRGISTNPTPEMIAKGSEIVRTFEPDVIITLGGGSVHDTAKAISLMATHEGSIEEYILTGKRGIMGIKNIVIPIITIPTISGTGAEISPASLVRINFRKEIVVSPYLFPKLSLIDPSVMTSAPPKLTAQVGFDAFIQGLEAYVSKNAQPFSDMFALSAMKHTIKYLPIAVRKPNDVEARSYIALAAIESVFAIAQAGVGAIHALSDPLSGRYNIHHGLALAMLAPKVIMVNLESNVEKYAKISELFGVDIKAHSHEKATKELPSKIQSFLADIGLDTLPKLGDLGVTEKDLENMVFESRNPDMSTNPKELSDEEILSIFKSLI